MNEIYDCLEAGLVVFPLHGIKDGECKCGKKSCTATGKHPQDQAWQHATILSAEAAEEMLQRVTTGYGVLCNGLLVVDVDPRNGGNESLKNFPINLVAASKFVVATGGGGLHIYFKSLPELALVSKLAKFPGIDFKSSGFVVGPGSLHKSGATYEIEKGFPHDIDNAPSGLLQLLTKPNRIRAKLSRGSVDIEYTELENILNYIKDYDDYDTWLRVGMALHNATLGSREAYELWDAWSQLGEKYKDASETDLKWHSFGKADNPVTLATLIYYAQQNGYIQPVTWGEEPELNFDNDNILKPEKLDLNSPPGYTGDVCKWINDQCRYPRERLAAIAAIQAVSCIAGMNYEDVEYGVTGNMFTLNVAGSATGKEAIQQAQAELIRTAGLGASIHGAIKSEQEIVRNLIEHQAANYIIDEIGYFLTKVKNAKEKGGASYLESVIGILMSIYSKADSFYLLTGDVKRALKKELANKIKSIEEEQPEAAETLQQQLASLDSGIPRPWLSLSGFTTPVSFDSLVDHEQATNGFIGRALIIREPETNPPPKRKFKKRPLAAGMAMTLALMYEAGQPPWRVEGAKARKTLSTTPEAIEYLQHAEDSFYAIAEHHKAVGGGLESIPRRSFEQVLKISFCLALPAGVRTLADAQWAYAYVMREMREKVNLAAGNTAESNHEQVEALQRRIIGYLDAESSMSEGVLLNKFRSKQRYRKDDVLTAIEKLLESGLIKKQTARTKKNRENVHYLINS